MTPNKCDRLVPTRRLTRLARMLPARQLTWPCVALLCGAASGCGTQFSQSPRLSKKGPAIVESHTTSPFRAMAFGRPQPGERRGRADADIDLDDYLKPEIAQASKQDAPPAKTPAAATSAPKAAPAEMVAAKAPEPAVQSATVVGANEPVPEAPVLLAARTSEPAPASRAPLDDYAQRQAQSQELLDYKGGDVIVISASTVVIVLLVVLLVVLLT